MALCVVYRENSIQNGHGGLRKVAKVFVIHVRIDGFDFYNMIDISVFDEIVTSLILGDFLSNKKLIQKLSS